MRRYLNLRGNAIAEVKCGTFNAAPKLMHLDMTSNPSSCQWDPVSDELLCDCLQGASAGGAFGYCSNTCTAGVVATPVRPESGDKIDISYSAEKVLDVLQSFDTNANFRRYESVNVGASGTDAMASSGIGESGTQAAVAASAVFLAAAVGFTVYVQSTT